MSGQLNYSDEAYDELEDEYKKYNNQLMLHISKVGLILVALIWGVFLSINSIPGAWDAGLSKRREGFSKKVSTSKDGLAKINFSLLRNGTFEANFQQVEWVGGVDTADDRGLYVTIDENSHILKSAFDESFASLLFEGDTMTIDGKNHTVEYFKESPDLKRGIIRTDSVDNWRHSKFGTYFVYSLEHKNFRLLGDNIALAVWSPDSQYVAYVYENDVYIFSVLDDEIKRVTFDGSEILLNGRADWVYEEEVLETGTALWWSPSSTYLAYFKTNDEQVHEFPVSYYLSSEDAIYPEIRKLKYPKSGTQGPIVSLNIYEVGPARNSIVNLKDNTALITEVKWLGDTQILAKVMDRVAQRLSVILVNAQDNGHTVTPRVENANNTWWEVTHKTMFIQKDETNDRLNDGYIDLIPVNGYNHLAYYSPPDNPDPIILTSGDWEVDGGPASFDRDSNDLYFFGTKKSSMERHLYYVNLLKPLTVNEVTDTSKEGTYYATFSGSSRFLHLRYNGPGVPYQKLIDLKSDVDDKQLNGNVIGETLYYVEENKNLIEVLKNYSVPARTFGELNLGKDADGEEILVNYFEILPPDFDASLRNHYPVFFYTYGGPTSQQVIKTFSVSNLQVFASELDAIVVVVDGRGTGFKGHKFRSVVHGNLGDLEASDQIAAAKLYGEKSYVNKNKISIFGWSYGGYLTLKTLEKDSGQYFKYGIAVAPVTDWHLYDSVYTERYMLTPKENPDGYAKSKVHNATSFAQVPRFLLIHGSGDDNVHFQHSLKFLDMLNLEQVMNYDLMVFPDSRHDISFHNAHTVIYERLLNWARQAFNGDFIQ